MIFDVAALTSCWRNTRTWSAKSTRFNFRFCWSFPTVLLFSLERPVIHSVLLGISHFAQTKYLAGVSNLLAHTLLNVKAIAENSKSYRVETRPLDKICRDESATKAKLGITRKKPSLLIFCVEAVPLEVLMPSWWAFGLIVWREQETSENAVNLFSLFPLDVLFGNEDPPCFLLKHFHIFFCPAP